MKVEKPDQIAVPAQVLAVCGAETDMAMLLVTLERGRQIFGRGYGTAHDDTHAGCELAAAACYAAGCDVSVWDGGLWPWPDMQSPSEEEPVLRRMVKAGALILAEIERLLRAGADPHSALAGEVPADILGLVGQVQDVAPRVCQCIACGCNDLEACEDAFGEPCGWLRIDREAGLGVCSECPEAVAAWDLTKKATVA